MDSAGAVFKGYAVIHLDTSDPALRIRVEHAGADRIFGASRLSYQEDIQVAALAMSGFLAGLASLPGSFLRQDISGGQDSRLALAATLAGGIDTAKLELQSVARLSNDMEVATRVADHLGLTLNGPANHKPVSTSYPPFAVWFAASAGVYDPLYALNTRLGQNALFMVGGHGAEVYKGNYGWHPVRRIAGWVGPDIADAVSHAARSGLESFGIDPASQTASEWHYLAFRNPLHGGRFINSTLYGVRPILNRRLVSVAHKTMRKRWWRARRPSTVISDLLIHINPDLAALPFDTAAKTLSPGYIAKRGKLLGKMPPTQPYAIQGRPEHTLSGPLPGLINTAIRAGFDGSFKTQVILDMLEKAHDLAPDALKSQVQAMVAMVTSGLTDPVTPDSRPSRMAGKMLTLFLTG